MPPCARLEASALGLVEPVDEPAAADMLEEPETVRTGDTDAIAEPGRGGSVLDDRAFFWANIASLIEGFAVLIVLLESPNPGRGAGSAF